MLDLEIIPERSLRCENYWEFILGMHFSQAVAIIQSQVNVIKGVQVLYSESKPLEVDMVLNLPFDGIRLIFDAIEQRLKTIEVYNMKLVKLKYYGLPFNSPEIAPSIEQIEHSFGATHPGIYDSHRQMFALNFRGLTFYFPSDTGVNANYAHGLSSLHFNVGASPIVSKMLIYNGNNLSECTPPPMPLSCYNNQLYSESVTVLREANITRGIRIALYTEAPVRVHEARKRTLTRDIVFGDTCQDVTSKLGSPNQIYYKADDKMKIHAPSAHQLPLVKRSDYYFNYYTLGIDVLFDARTHRCRKLILHTNYPGHYNFNMYHRCEFDLKVNADKCPDGNLDEIDKEFTITSFCKWDNIVQKIEPSERPVVLHRAGTLNSSNPFGSTFCYGYQDIIFEVMANNHLASITLHSNSSNPASWRKDTCGMEQIKQNSHESREFDSSNTITTA